MKKILLPIAAAALTLMAANAQAANGTVKFTGSIVKSACDVTSGDASKEVFIGKYPTSAFKKVGDVTASKAFTINLANCESGNYTLRFDGPTVSGNPNLLAVNAATGVGIEILDNNEKTLPINQSSDANSPWVAIASTDSQSANGSAAFNLKARYKSYNTAVTAGDANASSSFTIEYK
ncbi:fimbrial protein [Erwinia piriflorinigrans]|uniref:Fimbrin-like protein fimI n=1 Tax=Erwinia piriflorinigrans CFBP 5888 TaxID=1161919 RepID=V5ZCB5_9GAMM|nr:fimbrial protein [Erwinia piriflorinigrans]CCG88998.1 Fimbrin-like protein fimI [Erwinia piriflorinigrans CFBP 5888]